MENAPPAPQGRAIAPGPGTSFLGSDELSEVTGLRCRVCNEQIGTASRGWAYHLNIADGESVSVCSNCDPNEIFKAPRFNDRTDKTVEEKPRIWPCAGCGAMQGGGMARYVFAPRVEDQGRTAFDICLDCWQNTERPFPLEATGVAPGCRPKDHHVYFTRGVPVNLAPHRTRTLPVSYETEARHGEGEPEIDESAIGGIAVDLVSYTRLPPSAPSCRELAEAQAVCSRRGAGITPRVPGVSLLREPLLEWAVLGGDRRPVDLEYFDATIGLAVRCRAPWPVASFVEDDHGRVGFNVVFSSWDEFAEAEAAYNATKRPTVEESERLTEALVAQMKKESEVEEADCARATRHFGVYLRLVLGLQMYYG